MIKPLHFGKPINWNTQISTFGFQSLLSALWLRPESALWYAYLLRAARDFSVDRLAYPSMDFGCMDGLNSYLLLGGQPPFNFDVFDNVTFGSDMHLKVSLDDDYYDHFEGANSALLNRVDRPFTIGLDWKKSHIEKARQFGAHSTFLLSEQSKVLESVSDNSISAIWAPNLYWMKNLEEVIMEFGRVTMPGGRIVTVLPDIQVLDTMVMRHADRINPKWISYLDRGRYENASRSARSHVEWLMVFDSCRMEVKRHDMFLPAAINRIYEIGFRPMFGPLLQMRSSLLGLGAQELLKVKKIWVDRLLELTYPLLDSTLMESVDNKMLWHIFELQPRKT